MSSNRNSRQSCVFGCYTKGVTVHDFPNPDRFPEQFQKWVNIVGKQLTNLPIEAIYRKMKVCHIHFTEKDWNRNNRLNAMAVPSLHIPASSVHYALCTVQEDHSYCRQYEGNTNLESTSKASTSAFQIKMPFLDISNIPSTSKKASGAGPCIHHLEQIETEEKALPTQEAENVTSEAENVTSEAENVTSQGPFIDNSEQIEREEKALPTQEAENVTSEAENVTSQGSPVLTKSMHRELKATTQKSKKVSKDSKLQPSLQLQNYKTTQRTIKNLRREIIRLRKRSISFKTRLDSAEKLCDNSSFHHVTRDMTNAAKLFTDMQFRQTRKKSKGRRFSLDQKILSLSLYKRSPKGYGLLSKIFTLPSAKTLRNLLAKIKVEPGINRLIFKKIKITASKMSPQDKLCTLIFDEMFITPKIKYDMNKDEIKGLSETNEKKEIADHVLVFMVKGIKRNYKQHVAYYFSQSLKKETLKAVLKDVVKHVLSTGLNILCTICDQSSVNVSTINSLIEDTKKQYLSKGKEMKTNQFEIKKKKIIPLYDVPHLMKGIRNNLLSKDLKYRDPKDGNKEKIIKWSFFQDLYQADKSYGELRCLPKLTEEHINPSKINKMRVKPAVQILSRSVAVATEHITARGDLHGDCKSLIPFVLLMDNLFDSLNVSTFQSQNGKMYKGAVKVRSPHHALWKDCIYFLKNVSFLTPKKQGTKICLVETTVPSVTNFIKTIIGFQQLWNILHNKYEFDSMLTRNFNQDPLENFFGNIRSQGARNVSPDSVSFEGAYKALLLNNFCSRHSIKSNCEEDINTALQTLDFFIKEKEPEKPTQDNTQFDLNENIIVDSDMNVPDVGSSQRNYVCGWVVKKCLSNLIKSCKTCRAVTLSSKNDIESNSYIVAKEYRNDKEWLVYPSEEVVKCFFEIQMITINFIKTNVKHKNIKSNIKILTDIFVNFRFDCDTHGNKLRDYFEDNVINVILCSWCRSINRILTGKISYDGDDTLKNHAVMYYNKHKHFKNKK